MTSQDPTPPTGIPISEPDSAPDPLWAPTAAQRADAQRTMPLGTPPQRVEPARTSYGPAPEPTVVLPSAEVPRVAAEHPRPAYDVPVAYERQVVAAPPRKPVWPYVVAVLALVVGGAIGWLVSRSDDDDDTITDQPATTLDSVVPGDVEPDVAARLDELLAQTQANGAYVSDPDFPQIDEIVAIERAAAAEELEGQVSMLSVANEDLLAQVGELETQVATLESSLATAEAERDELQAQIDGGAMTDDEFLDRLQEKEDEITALEDQLATAQTQLTEAQAAAEDARADLATAEGELQTLRQQLDALDAMEIERYIDQNISAARDAAAANGWILIEREVDFPQFPAGAITSQKPDPGEIVIRGGVVYVEFNEETP